MKKLISILAALLLVFAFCTACGETTETSTATMTFRNGITFGMTQDEVKAAETVELHDQTFGENQNPHVTVLAADSIDLGGHDSGVQYLFWDGKMYSVLYTFTDEAFYDELRATFESSYGAPSVSSAEGTANWVESVSGNHPEMTGDQYVWSWSNNISLTMAHFSHSYIVLYIDAN